MRRQRENGDENKPDNNRGLRAGRSDFGSEQKHVKFSPIKATQAEQRPQGQSFHLGHSPNLRHMAFVAMRRAVIESG